MNHSSSQKMVMPILLAVSLTHLFNDVIQAVVTAIYPMLKSNYALSFTQIGLISLAYQITASLIQPWIGLHTDKFPKPYLLPSGMVITLCGIVALAYAPNFYVLLLSGVIIGLGSAIFHPEASRVARTASNGHFGTAQAAFQVGGNTGSALGPLLVAVWVAQRGQESVLVLIPIALLAIAVLYYISRWTIAYQNRVQATSQSHTTYRLQRNELGRALSIIALLMVVKFTYIASLSNYFTFFLIEKFALSLSQAQLCLFAFMGAVAVGTFAGGPIGDRIGRYTVIWFSFVGMVPFALVLPYANLLGTMVCAIGAGLIMSSAFSAMIVYAQEAIPNRVGLISGAMFGFMFGISGIGSALLGMWADKYGIQSIFQFCAYLPLLGVVAWALPKHKVRD
ncbi:MULTISPECIES: MFS transporter [Glaesserella]|uniref:MFS transporter n=1 Tax=Glaesserella australis TaxID=2094024 RepID=A0A328C3R0_9PAST|nr:MULTISPECIES: MFS transporter [Glaesserella]AUI66871.1 MFS transporter [Glaesserella sp. 15-184]RAL19922.1 MFS transporter [Glaesserella australis]